MQGIRKFPDEFHVHDRRVQIWRFRIRSENRLKHVGNVVTLDDAAGSPYSDAGREVDILAFFTRCASDELQAMSNGTHD